jgi:hypothetical protein
MRNKREKAGWREKQKEIIGGRELNIGKQGERSVKGGVNTRKE